MADSTWEARELPILEAVARAEAKGRFVANNNELAETTGLERDTVDLGLFALRDARYLTGVDAAAEELCYLLEIRLLERGRRAIRQWPSEDAADTLLELLSARVAAASTEEDRSRWQRLLDAAKGLGGAALRELTITWIERQAGLG